MMLLTVTSRGQCNPSTDSSSTVSITSQTERTAWIRTSVTALPSYNQQPASPTHPPHCLALRQLSAYQYDTAQCLVNFAAPKTFTVSGHFR